MKLSRSDLERMGQGSFEIDSDFEIRLNDHPRCREIRDVHVSGKGFYDSLSQNVTLNLNIMAKMIVPCAISFNPVPLDVDMDVEEIFSFIEVKEDDTIYSEEDECIYVEDDLIDLEQYVLSALLAEIPLKVIDPNLEEYPSGDGWIVMTEEDYLKEKSEQIDPRLAKLKDLDIE